MGPCTSSGWTVWWRSRRPVRFGTGVYDPSRATDVGPRTDILNLIVVPIVKAGTLVWVAGLYRLRHSRLP